MATESLDRFFNAKQDATSIAHTLDQMSWTMYDAGNERMGEMLEDLALDLKMDISQMDDAFGEVLSDWFKSTNESTGNMLRLALGMSGLTPSEDEGE